MNLLKNEIKDLTFEVCKLSNTFFFKNYFLWGSKHRWHPHRKEARSVTDSTVFKQQIYFFVFAWCQCYSETVILTSKYMYIQNESNLKWKNGTKMPQQARYDPLQIPFLGPLF